MRSNTRDNRTSRRFVSRTKQLIIFRVVEILFTKDISKDMILKIVPKGAIALLFRDQLVEILSTQDISMDIFLKIVPKEQQNLKRGNSELFQQHSRNCAGSNNEI